MAAKLEKTRYPGIYKRGSRYVVTYRVSGSQKRETVATLKEAREIKTARESDRDRGEYQEQSRVRFREYAAEWVERYQGRGGHHGFDEGTRDDYRRDLARYAYPYFDEKLGRKVSEVTPRDVNAWVAWICDENEQGRRHEAERRERIAKRAGTPLGSVPAKPIVPKRLADATVRRILSPVRACLSTARKEGIIRHNPADGATLPYRETVRTVEDEDGADVRALSREQLDALLRVAPTDYRPLLYLLAETGIRWGEAAALRRGDLVLDGPAPVVRVRRALGKPTDRERAQAAASGTKLAPRFKAPKSKHGKRDVPLSDDLVELLRSHLRRLRPDDQEGLAFPSRTGTPLRQENVRRRYLAPAASEAGAPWCGFHTFRHTFASLHMARGTNVLVLSRLLGHHSPEFTLGTYAHLLPGDETPALNLSVELSVGRTVTTDLPETDRTEPEPIAAGATG